MENNKIKNSLIPQWTFNTVKSLNIPECKIIENPKITDYAEYIKNGFKTTNKNNGLLEELTLENINVMTDLHKLGVEFEFSIINILDNDVIFPICDVGKNRSQFLFYYLKNLQSKFNNAFFIGYPASGDELNTIFVENKSSVLSGFQVPYKSDSFSNAMYSVFGKEYSRSIHIFDSVLKEEEPYSNQDLQNLEYFKYKNHKYDIFNKDCDFIKELFKKYYLNPDNLRKVINCDEFTNYRITYLCLSPSSFISLSDLLYRLNKKMSNVKIVYFGVQDIFQRSSINQSQLNDFITKINSSVKFKSC